MGSEGEKGLEGCVPWDTKRSEESTLRYSRSHIFNLNIKNGKEHLEWSGTVGSVESCRKAKAAGTTKGSLVSEDRLKWPSEDCGNWWVRQLITNLHLPLLPWSPGLWEWCRCPPPSFPSEMGSPLFPLLLHSVSSFHYRCSVIFSPEAYLPLCPTAVTITMYPAEGQPPPLEGFIFFSHWIQPLRFILFKRGHVLKPFHFPFMPS